MNPDVANHLISQMLWTSVLISAPILGIALVVGLVVSILQVITQVQEMSLTFIPKLAAVLASLGLLGPWMLKKTMAFASAVISNIPNYF